MRTQRDTGAHAAQPDVDRTRETRAESTGTRRDQMDRDVAEREMASRDVAARDVGGGRRTAAEQGYTGPDVVRDVSVVTAAAAPAALALLGGIWLVISRLVFNYPVAGIGAAGVLNGIVIGIAIALIATARLINPRSNPVLSVVTAVLGGWMIASPWVFGYSHWRAGSGPVWSDVITGAVIAIAGLTSWSTVRPRDTRAARLA
jgi:SPW repeat